MSDDILQLKDLNLRNAMGLFAEPIAKCWTREDIFEKICPAVTSCSINASLNEIIWKSVIWHPGVAAYLMTRLWFEQQGIKHWIVDGSAAVYCADDDLMMFELYAAPWRHVTTHSRKTKHLTQG